MAELRRFAGRCAGADRKAERREALFGIVGLGYVGLPLAVELAKAGYRVLGFDILQRVVDGLNDGRSVKDITDAQLQEALAAGRFEATTDMSRLGEPDAVSICVPTPLSKFKDPDVSYIVAATDAVKRTLRRGQAIILESTTYPGTTREILQPALESTGLKIGSDFFLAFSPERVDPAIRSGRRTTRPRSSAALPSTAPGWRSRSTSPRSRSWCPSPPPRRPSW